MSAVSRRDFLGCSASLLAAGTLTPALLAQQKAGPYADAVLKKGEPPLPAEGSFTVAVLPDTQNYSEKFPDTFIAQTKWIAEQKQRRNIQAVLHLGDITNRNTDAEWQVAQQAMQQLDGHVPYFMVPGNHDYSEGGSCKDRTTKINEYFPLSKLKNQKGFGGVYDREPERVENSYHTLTIGGQNLLFMGLEFGPRSDILRWANEILSRHLDHQVILFTHAHTYHDDTIYDWAKFGAEQKWNPHSYAIAKATNNDVNDASEVFELVINRRNNVAMVLSGHVLYDGLGRVSQKTDHGNTVHQLLVNFQMRPQGGDGWLRLLEFSKDLTRVKAIDYSPTLGQRNESKQNAFELQLS